MLQIRLEFGYHDNKPTEETPLEIYNRNARLKNPTVLHRIISEAVGINLNDLKDVKISPISKCRQYRNDETHNYDYFHDAIYINIGEPNNNDVQINVECTYDGWWLAKVDNPEMISSYDEKVLPAISTEEINAIRDIGGKL